jgi:predicted HTH domain antitoxin/tetrahydromethanopterin S-methyltransferase subunit G
MCPFQSCFGRLLFVAAMLVIAGTEQIARAQDDERSKETTQAIGSEARVLAFRAWVDNWTASRLAMPGVKLRDFLETLLLRRIKHLAADSHLTAGQLKKLELAGRGDIKRFMDRLDHVAENFEFTVADRAAQLQASLELEAAWKDVQAGFFVRSSLFMKTLARMLSPGQVDERVTVVSDRADSRLGIGTERLDAEAQFGRSELMQLTWSAYAKQDFDRWVWRELRSPVERRTHLRMHLSHRLRELVGDCNLTWAQFKKLELAGTDDINRFLERLEEFERRFTGTLSFVNDFPVREAESLKRFYLNDFGVDSSFSKTMANTLSDEQRALCEQRLGERNRVRYLTAIHQVAVSLARAVRMSEAERTTFEELLQKETRRPRKFGRSTPSEFQNVDSEVVLVQASRISETKLREALGEPCCDKLSRRLSRWSGVDAEMRLKSHGFILDERPAAAQPDHGGAGTKTERL